MKPPFVINPSRNATLQKAWADLRADDRKQKKAADVEAKADKAPAKKPAAKKGRTK